jgi:hypothetical protein
LILDDEFLLLWMVLLGLLVMIINKSNYNYALVEVVALSLSSLLFSYSCFVAFVLVMFVDVSIVIVVVAVVATVVDLLFMMMTTMMPARK